MAWLYENKFTTSCSTIQPWIMLILIYCIWPRKVFCTREIKSFINSDLRFLKLHYFFVLTVSTSSLASLSLLDAENLPMVNVGAHNSDTEYHRYLGTLQSPSPLNLSQNLSNDVELKPQAIKSKNIMITMILQTKFSQVNWFSLDGWYTCTGNDKTIKRSSEYQCHLHSYKAEESSLATTLDISDTSSLLGELDYMTESSSLDTLSPELEILSQEMANKGPRQSEMELR